MNDFKEVLLILLRFLGIWLIMFLLYQFYLNQYADGIDPYSKLIATQSEALLKKSGYLFTTKDFPQVQTIQFYFEGKPATRFIEGCNAISVMILFLAFVFAFYKKTKTYIFSLFGLLALYMLNLFRIWALNIVVAECPEWTKAVHDYFFPLLIYGGMVILWVIWMNRYIGKNENV